jgi:hypothetical protein
MIQIRRGAAQCLEPETTAAHLGRDAFERAGVYSQRSRKI